MKRGADAYGKLIVATAPPAELVDRLFTRAVGECQAARAAIAFGDVAGKARAIAALIDIVDALSGALDHVQAPELCKNLASLYDYVQIRATRGSIDRDPLRLDEAASVLCILRDAFARAATR